MPLSDAKVRALKGKERPYEISDAEGLYVFVTTAGSRRWAWSYRFAGHQKTLAFGKYPLVSVLEARRLRNDAKRMLLQGIDPSAARKADKRRRSMAAANTFEAVAKEWFKNNEFRWVEKYSLRLRSRLEDDLFPALADGSFSALGGVRNHLRILAGAGADLRINRIPN